MRASWDLAVRIRAIALQTQSGTFSPMKAPAHLPALRRTVLIVAVLNLAYFGVEFAVALAIGSVSLFADSADFLEDASVNILIGLALGWSLKARSRVGMALAGILLAPALALLCSLCGDSATT